MPWIRGKAFVGQPTATSENFQEALLDAIANAQAAYHPDALIEWRFDRCWGRRGGVVGLHELYVQISVLDPQDQNRER
jgi:hypothetical protein